MARERFTRGSAGRGRTAKAGAGRSRAWAAALLSAALCAGSIAAAAQAQEDPVGDAQDQAEQVEQVRQAEATAEDPGPACVEQTQVVVSGEGAPGCDTKYTPVLKDGCATGWVQVAGDVHPDGRPCERGYDPADVGVPSTVDFFTAHFANDFNGLAGGAACADGTPEEELDTCTRYPIIYRYQLDERGLPQWREVFRGTEPGYVGAIAWLTRDSALAVGGTGCYPRREVPEACPPGNPGNSADPVGGEGRAWYSADVRAQARFRSAEFTGSAPGGVTGMAAVASTYGLSPSRLQVECGASVECAYAGGIRELWIWKDGAFQPDPVDPGDSRVRSGSGWRYRVRTIKFAPEPQVGAFAATSGCCRFDEAGAPDPTQHGASTLQWAPTLQPPWRVSRVNDHDAVDTANAGGAVLPDSIYALIYRSGAGLGSFLWTPGGAESKNEPGSYVVGGDFSPLGSGSQLLGDSPSGHNGGLLAGPALTAVRLVAGDGDGIGYQPNFCQRAAVYCGSQLEAPKRPDGVMDWAVGELRTSHQGAAYTSAQRAYGGPAREIAPYPLACPEGAGPGSIAQGNVPLECAADEKAPKQIESTAYFTLPSYALNGFVTIPGTGTSWAVGDRGALLRLGGQAASATLPPENRPGLGARRHAELPEHGALADSHPELSDSPGMVPPLAAQPRTGAPQLTSYGAPDPFHRANVAGIAMSRDGGEGWAVGPAGDNAVDPMSLYRFDGVRWRACRFHRVGSLVDADPACAGIAALRDANGGDGVRITAIARIPLENDLDPANDDDFEAIAATSPAEEVTGSDGPVILRYRKGVWAIDEAATGQTDPLNPGAQSVFSRGRRVTDLAFAAPDDGWMIGTEGGASPNVPRIFHFDGNEWMQCTRNESTGSAQSNSAQQVNPERCMDMTPDRDANPGNGHQGILPATDWRCPGLPHLAVAGDRVYLYGTRAERQQTVNAACGGAGRRYPMILYKDPGPCEEDGDAGCWNAALDPKYGVGGDPDDPSVTGTLMGLSVAQASDGTYTGWGVGSFGRPALAESDPPLNAVNRKVADAPRETATLRAASDGITWSPYPVEGPARDYLLHSPPVTERVLASAQIRPAVLASPAPGGRGDAIVVPNADGVSAAPRPALRIDGARDRWEVFPTPWDAQDGAGLAPGRGGIAGVGALAPDERGGFWFAAREYTCGTEGVGVRSKCAVHFYRYGSEVPQPVFEDVQHPIREWITASATGEDGSFWVATNSNAVYRYDRIAGWDRVAIPGWDPGQAVTRASRANAIAIGPDGAGIVVGENGRIAEVGAGGAVLDRASGVLCATQGNEPPCGTGRDLHAAAVAPDGSALAGGRFMALLWRPPDGEFSALKPPPTCLCATIASISMPRPDRAWLVTDNGEVWAGSLVGNAWQWSQEATDDFGDTLARDASSTVRPLNAIAIDSSGTGYAVGDHGVILSRAGGEWKWLDAGYREQLTAAVLGPGGRGALIGGESGTILTESEGQFQPARPAAHWDPLSYGERGGARIVGFGLLAGPESGQVEAWAVSQAFPPQASHPRPTAVLHYSSDPSDSLLDPARKTITALRDTAAEREGEISIAAFGRSECQYSYPCPEILGANMAHDLIARQIRDEVLAGGATRPDVALFTGDVGRFAGKRTDPTVRAGIDPSWVHNRWREIVAEPLQEGGVPVFAAIGGSDLAKPAQFCAKPFLPSYCPTEQLPAHELTKVGPNFTWRRAFAGMAEPWGAPERSTEAVSRSGLEFVAVRDSQIEVEPGDQRASVSDPSATVGDQDLDVPMGGARTHYAFDVERDGDELMRVAVVDTSLRSLAGSNALQNPIEEQLGWLEEVLATTPTGARKVVLSNTPTYSYGPGAGSETQQDAAVFEQTVIRHGVDLVISGRLGWNGVYWAMAPGLHYPCPGSAHPDPNEAPKGASACELDTSGAPDPTSVVAGSEDLAPRAVPFVVASSAGGRFGPQGEDRGPAEAGFWRGYSVIRMLPNSNEEPIIEQRPVFDWIGIEGPTHVLAAGARAQLDGFGREPAALDVHMRYVDLDSQAITHAYDLVLADPERPWTPCVASDPGCVNLAGRLESSGSGQSAGPPGAGPAGEDSCHPYVCLPRRVGQISEVTGEVSAGDGRYPDTFAIAMLSVNKKVATYPIVFTKSPSFVVQPLSLTPQVPGPPNLATNAPQPPNPPNPPQPQVPQASLPEVPPPPGIPPLSAAAPLEPQPPAPPAPPPPAEQATALSLTLAPPTVAFATPTAVIQPPTPPVNPAPPSGARREARQRQAAAQKSGADSEKEGMSDAQNLGGDPANAPDSPDQRMARRDRTKAELSFTAVARADQPSAWTQGLLYTGALTLMAAALAAGFSRGRPTPRQREPRLPAPAYSDLRRHRH